MNFLRHRPTQIAIASVALAALLPMTASAQLAPYYTQLMNTVQQEVVRKLMAAMGLGLEGAVAESSAAIQGEVLKGTIAKRLNEEALQAYRQEQEVNRAAQEARDKLKAPELTCTAVAAQSGLSNASQDVPVRVAAGHKTTMQRIQGTTSTMQRVDEMHKATNAAFCTPAEAARGICTLNPANSALAGADQSAAFLFQGADGSLTYSTPEQSRAVDNYINRIVATVPVESLSGKDYDTNPRSRAFVELARRYNSIVSMTAYSLRMIKESHAAIAGLGTATRTASVDQPGFSGGKTDMSMAEAVQRYIAMKFSPSNMRDAALATNENLILRDLAQTQAFQLWLEQQTMHHESRTESIMAMQLAMLTENVMRPSLAAQRAAAANTSAIQK